MHTLKIRVLRIRNQEGLRNCMVSLSLFMPRVLFTNYINFTFSFYKLLRLDKNAFNSITYLTTITKKLN